MRSVSRLNELFTFSSLKNALFITLLRKTKLIHPGGQSQLVSGIALGTFEIFSKLDMDARNEIARNTHQRIVEKGQYIISAENNDSDVYFLISGNVRVCSFSHNGKPIHFDELSSGMMFGELSAIDNRERSSDCISVSKCTLAVMKASQFRQIISDHQTVRDAVLLRLASMVRDNMQRVYEFSALSVPQRIRCELLRLASVAESSQASEPDSDIRLVAVPTHAEIAARISTHREAVTRELKSLETLGIITWKPKKYVIHDITYLSEIKIKPN